VLDVLTTPGVYFFVGAKGQPAIIPLGEIDPIRRATETSLRIEPYPFLRYGDRVRVKSGPFEGIEGILVLKKNLYRLVLSVELLGRSAAMEIDGSVVEQIRTPVSLTASHSLPGPRPTVSLWH
jgi:transcription antitermination factor NusG